MHTIIGISGIVTCLVLAGIIRNSNYWKKREQRKKDERMRNFYNKK